MSVDDDERQASPGARQAGRVARCPPGAPTCVARQRRGVRPLLRAWRPQVGTSARHRPRRAGSGVGAAISRVAAPGRRQGPGRHHGRTPRRGDVAARRLGRGPAARCHHRRPGGRRRRRSPRRRRGGPGDHLRHVLRVLHRSRGRRPSPRSGSRDDSGLAVVVHRRHRRGAGSGPWPAAGGLGSTDRGAGGEDPPARR